MKSAPLPPAHIVLRAFLCLIVSGLLLAAVRVAWFSPTPSPDAMVMDIPLRQAQAVAGKLQPTDNGIAVESYAPAAQVFYSILSWRDSFSAEDYDLLVYELNSLDPPPAMQLGWRRADNMAALHNLLLPTTGETAPVAALHNHPEWRGEIIELGIHVTSPTADMPFELTRLSLLPSSAGGDMRAHLSAWQHFKGWTHFSINQLYAGMADHPPSAVQAAAAWAGLALLFALAWQLLSGTASFAVLVAIALVPWLALDLLWQKNLADQLNRSQQIFAGKTQEEKHLADQDSYVYEFARTLKEQALPQDPARILMLYVNDGHQFERLRLQYYLLPHNIYNFNKLPAPGQEQQVDYVIIIGDKLPPDMRIKGRSLIQGRRELPMQLVKSGSLGHLFRVEHSALEVRQ